MVAVSKLAGMRHPKNPNRHPPEQIRVFKKILSAQDWRRPIVVSNLSKLIVSGHGALEAALELKWKQAPVEYQDFASEGLELAHMSADNELARLSESDATAVEALGRELDELSLDREIAALLAESEPVELRKVAVTEPPEMTWILIGIPTVRYGEVNAAVEALSGVPGALVETTVASAPANAPAAGAD